MSCPIQTKLTTELFNKGAIKKGTREIINLNRFISLNNFYTRIAEDKYGLKGYGKTLFDIEDKYIKIGNKGAKKYIARAVPNESLFSLLNDIVNEYQKDKDTTTKRVLSIDIIQENGEDIWIISEEGTNEEVVRFNSFTEATEYIKDNGIIEKNEFVDFTNILDENEDEFIKVNEQLDQEPEINKSIPYHKLDSLEKRQNYILDTIKDNLEENLRKYDYLIKRMKDPSKIERYSNKLKELFNNIESFDESKQWHAISLFTNQLKKNLESLEIKLNKEDFSNPNEIFNVTNLYDQYLQSHSLVSGLLKFVEEVKASKQMRLDELPVNEEDVDLLIDELRKASSLYDSLRNRIHSFNRRGMTDYLNDRRYTPEIITKWTRRLEKEHKELGITENRTSWVSRQLNTTYKEEIDKDVENYIKGILNDVSFDITWATRMFNASLNTNSRMVQIMQHMINDVKENIIQQTREKDLEYREIFEEFIKQKGNKKPSILYKNLLDYDSSGKAYLLGDYQIKFKEEYEKKLKQYKSQKLKIEVEYGSNSAELKHFYANSDFQKWVEENTIEIKDEETKIRRRIPATKWKNDLSKLSEIDKKVRELFINTTEQAHDQTFGIRSLISPRFFGTNYYSLPAVTKSDQERVIEGDSKGIIADKWKDLTTVREDDIGYEDKNISLDGNPIRHIKVHYRGNLDPSQQSLDLFTLYRLEARNGINFKEKHEKEMAFKTLVDIAREKDYYRTEGIRVPVIARNIGRNKRSEIKGSESQTYQKLKSMMETNIYDILHNNAGKIGTVDVNKAVRLANSYTALVGMSLNEVTALTNVMNGKSQLFLESIAGNVISGKSITKAEKIYLANLPDLFKDMSSPVKTSYVNQINEMFDTFGLISVSAEQAFIKNTLLRAHSNLKGLQFMQDSGEHWLQSSLTMSVLDGIKVMDANNNLINREGKIVNSEKEAASLLDMLYKDETGKLKVSDKVVYTTKSTGVKYNEGGKELINNLVKKKVFDLAGNYDSNMQPDIMKHWYGKLLMMYRRFLISMGNARYRGFAYASKKTEDLTPEQRFYSDALQEYEEGFYTTFVRFIWNGVRPALTKLSYQTLSNNWSELSSYEKKNIHKTIVEIAITAALLPAMRILVAAAMDDDDKLAWFALLEIRRLESELNSYRDPREQWRILNSPIPSMRMIQNIYNLGSRLVTPWTWDEQYKSGERKGMYKIQREAERLAPVLNSRNISYKEKYQYMINIID